MSSKSVTVVKQNEFVVPDLSIKDLLSAIPSVFFFQRGSGDFLIFFRVPQFALLQAVGPEILQLCVSALFFLSIPPITFVHCRSHCPLESVWDLIVIAGIYKAAVFGDSLVSPEYLNLPSPYFNSLARFAVWSLYGFAAGLFATGLWVIGHECGHQAFSESKTINNSVGWVLHSVCVLSVM
jgi:hypothetical protein